MNKFSKGILKFLLVLLVGAVVGYVINAFTNGSKQLFPIEVSNLVSTPVLVSAGLCVLLYGIFALNKVSNGENGGAHSGREGTTENGEKVKAYFSAKLVTKQELKTNKEFHFCYFSDLKNIKFDGIPLRAERVGMHTEINMQKPIHTLVIGTTGSGKTTMLVEPSIQIIGSCASHPSLIISDPKGELYARESQFLRTVGYDVQCINLREPNESSRVNPIEPAYLKFQRAHNLVKEVKVYQGKYDGKQFEPVVGATYGNEWYVFENVAYPDKATLKDSLTTKKQELVNSAYEDIQDIALALSPTSGQDH